MAHVNSLPDSTWKLTLSAVWDQIVLHHSVTMVAVVVFLLCPADLCSCIEFEGPIGQRWVANSPWHGHSWYLYTAPSVGPLQSLPNWVLSRWEQTTLQSGMIGGWSYGSWVLANATPLVLITSRFYRNHGHIFNEKVPDLILRGITTSWWIPSAHRVAIRNHGNGKPQYILFFMYCIYWLIIQKMKCFCFTILSHTGHVTALSIRKGSFRFTPCKLRSQASPQWRVPKPFHLSHKKRQQLEASSEHFLGWPISFVWTFIGF